MPTSRHPRVVSRHIAPFAPLAIAAVAHHLSSAPTEGVSGGVSAGPSALQLVCKLPFDAEKERHPIDDSCGAAGSSSAGTPQAMQNTAKNDFCESSSPVVLTFRNFDDLQSNAEQAHVTFGSDAQIPHNRAALASLLQVGSGATVGEGSVVRVAAYVLDAHYSNVSNGETVNCKTKGAEWNDIHIVLGEQPDANACDSVTAEMSPHFRPELWSPTTLNNFSGRPLRFTGHLFFDASHSPCSGGKGSPARRSLFEIHPVYSVDVCRTKPAASAGITSACDPANDENWVSMDQWTGDSEGSSETSDGND